MRGPKSIVHGHKAREYVIKVEKIENGNGNGNRAANEADVEPGLDPSCGLSGGDQNDLRPQLKTILWSILRQRSQSKIDSSK